MAVIRRALIHARRVLNSTRINNGICFSVTSNQMLPRTQYGGNGLLYRFTTQSAGPQSLEIDFSNEESKRRLCNRLLYRSKQRGFLELDLVLGRWVEENIHAMDETGVKELIHVLDLENPDLWKWLTGQEQPPEAVNANPVFNALRDKVMNNLDRHAAPETRAVPGRPWVRGWDDFKKGRDSPITGNQ